jgi:nicotinamide mononucleotide transporter
MSILEIIAVISTIVCVVLSAKEHILAWPIGIISVLSLIMVYIGGGMYAQIVLQVVFLVQCIIGWVNWGKKDGLKANIEGKRSFYIALIEAIVLGIVYALVILWGNGGKNPLFSYIDGISAFIALLGNWYLTKKTLQAWPLFMVYNVMLVYLLASQGIYLLALLNICLFFISFNAYRTWKRNLKEV